MSYNVGGAYKDQAKNRQPADQESMDPLVGANADRTKNQIEKSLNDVQLKLRKLENCLSEIGTPADNKKFRDNIKNQLT